MLSSIFYPVTLLAALAGIATAQQLTLLEPTADRWWVANSQNTLRWSGSTPAEFSVFINHPDPTVLTSKLALISVQPLYEYSKTITPTGLKPATGYVMELTNILNSTDIYVKSDAFEIKAAGSTYPPQITPGAPSASGSSSVSASVSGSAAAASSSRAAGDRVLSFGAGLGGLVGVGMAVAGVMGL